MWASILQTNKDKYLSVNERSKKLPVDIRRARKILTSADGMSIDTIFSSRRRPYLPHTSIRRKKKSGNRRG